MKILDMKSYQEIQLWMNRNARQIELARWKYEFENAGNEAVLTALALYQNSDGGFGNILEPDSWNPNSSPYTTLHAMQLLEHINYTDIHAPIIQGLFQFLESGVHSSDNGWLFSIPSNDNYAHAPWWTYSEEANEVESIGVTAGIASFVIQFADADTELYKKALLVSEHIINKLDSKGSYGEMGISGYCKLAATIEKVGLTGRFDYEFLQKKVRGLVYDSIERDTSKWSYYGVRPSNYINSPDSIYYQENADIVQKELDYLIDTRPENDVWGITWSWFDNNEKYPKEFAISENWWKASGAIDKINFLKKFGRLECI